MAAYPMTMVSRRSRAVPNAGIAAEIADDDTVKFRRDQASVHYDVRIIHEWITEAERDAILSFISTNGYANHTFTLKGKNYSGTLINEPEDRDQRGNLLTVEARFKAVRV